LKIKITVLTLALLLTVCGAAAAVGEDGSFPEFIPVFAPISAQGEEAGAQDAPLMDSVSVFAQGGQSVKFTSEDFVSRVADGKSLVGIIVTSLPASGRLSLDGRPIMAGEAVTADQFDKLSFIPASVSAPTMTFHVLPVMGEGVWKTPVAVNMTIRDGENRPPVAENATVHTYKNVAIRGFLRARDPDGDALEFKVTSKPKRGDIALGAGGEFTYKPFNNKTGTDKITFVVIDSFGNISPEATITVDIAKSSAKASYQDMQDHPAAYAALHLMGEGIFIGEQICGQYYFKPELPVNRGEFIAMALRAVGMEDIEPSTVTGFADDGVMPAWVKPYAQAALKAGIISGMETADGRKYFNADSPISMSEAVVILNNAISIADVNTLSDAAAPVWAAQAAANLDAVGILPVALNGEQWGQSLTRADAAQLLSRSVSLTEDGKSSGLLSWVFGW
jgi:hypothetical protein